MKLSERLAEAGAAADSAGAETLPRSAKPTTDPLGELKRRVELALFDKMGGPVADLTQGAQLRDEVLTHLESLVAAEEHLLSDTERREIVNAVADNLLGLGPIQPFLLDPTVTEIMVNAPDAVFVERQGKLEKTDVVFDDHQHIRTIIERIVSKVGRRIDDSVPMVDARLPDGSRVNAVLPPLTIGSPTLTIRKFSQVAMGIDTLVAYGTLTEPVSTFLRACVESKCNILICGGTGSGKTTLLNALSAFIPEGERIIAVEDTAELQLQRDHVVRMEARPANVEGAGKVDIRDLVRNALRMRPDRIVVGECRGGEALDMLQAMNTGHEGSLTTLHANSSQAGLSRLETMVLTAGVDLPHRAIREQVVEAIDVIIQLTRLADGSRRVVEICEVAGIDSDGVDLRDIFAFDWDAGRDADGAFLGELRPTGVHPLIASRLRQRGHAVAPEIFGTGTQTTPSTRTQ
jgi:pilus assembly protein CpaF